MATKTVAGKKSTPARKRAAGATSAKPVTKKTPAKKRTRVSPLLVEGPEATMAIPRAVAGYDEDDVMLSGGPVTGRGFGRCGGRVLASRLEQQLCMLLSRNGITHSHSPRHFEVRYKEPAADMSKNEQSRNVAAYAPMIVLRGRGREGKTVVIEASGEAESPVLPKIRAFRRMYGIEFYLIFVAPEEVLDEISVDLYDESCTTNDIGTLINRLAD